MRTVRYTTRKRLGRARCLILRRRQNNGTAPGSDGNCLGHAHCCQSPRIRRRCRRWRCEQPTERRSRQRQPNFEATPRPRPSSDRRIPCSPIISLVVTRLTGCRKGPPPPSQGKPRRELWAWRCVVVAPTAGVALTGSLSVVLDTSGPRVTPHSRSTPSTLEPSSKDRARGVRDERLGAALSPVTWSA